MAIEYVMPQGGTNVTVYLTVVDSDGALLTGLMAASITAHYLRPKAASPVAISAQDLSTPDAAHADGGWVEVDATNMPGLYRFDLPDAAVASGENYVVVSVKPSGGNRNYGIIYLDPLPSIVQGTVVSDSNNSAIQFKTDLTEGNDDQFVDAYVLFRTGPNAGSVEKVSDYVGSTKILKTDEFPAVPSVGDEFVILNR